MNDDIYEYEVGTIINENRNIVLATNSLEDANEAYESIINKHIDSNNHIIVYIFDYNKNTNINYYDSLEQYNY